MVLPSAGTLVPQMSSWVETSAPDAKMTTLPAAKVQKDYGFRCTVTELVASSSLVDEQDVKTWTLIAEQTGRGNDR